MQPSVLSYRHSRSVSLCTPVRMRVCMPLYQMHACGKLTSRTGAVAKGHGTGGWWWQWPPKEGGWSCRSVSSCEPRPYCWRACSSLLSPPCSAFLCPASGVAGGADKDKAKKREKGEEESEESKEDEEEEEPSADFDDEASKDGSFYIQLVIG